MRAIALRTGNVANTKRALFTKKYDKLTDKRRLHRRTTLRKDDMICGRIDSPAARCEVDAV
tara:strand:- start:356 stop:538 length:183 start_codon:yes stop_codon:yes gene_type:complete